MPNTLFHGGENFSRGEVADLACIQENIR